MPDAAHRIEQRCDSCGVFDDHPRHQVCTDLGAGRWLYRHFDCCHYAGCHDGSCTTILQATRAAKGERLLSWIEGRMNQMGPAYHPWVMAGAPHMGGASGLDQNRVIDWLNATIGQSANASTPFTAVLATPFAAASGQTGHFRLMTVMGSSTVNGTELSGGSYQQGTGLSYTTGSGGNFPAATYSTGAGSTSNGTALSQSGMPTAPTIAGVELWDSAGTSPLYAASNRWWWGSFPSPIATTSGNTLTFAVGSISIQLNA